MSKNRLIIQIFEDDEEVATQDGKRHLGSRQAALRSWVAVGRRFYEELGPEQYKALCDALRSGELKVQDLLRQDLAPEDISSNAA
ncbi:hypothetical protein [Saccharopolyspora griseoalba]